MVKLGFFMDTCDHFEETWKHLLLNFYLMIIFTYFGLGITLILASNDPIIENSFWLLNFCIYSGFWCTCNCNVTKFIVGFWTWNVSFKCHGVMYPCLLIFSIELFYYKRQYIFKNRLAFLRICVSHYVLVWRFWIGAMETKTNFNFAHCSMYIGKPKYK